MVCKANREVVRGWGEIENEGEGVDGMKGPSTTVGLDKENPAYPSMTRV